MGGIDNYYLMGSYSNVWMPALLSGASFMVGAFLGAYLAYKREKFKSEYAIKVQIYLNYVRIQYDFKRALHYALTTNCINEAKERMICANKALHKTTTALKEIELVSTANTLQKANLVELEYGSVYDWCLEKLETLISTEGNKMQKECEEKMANMTGKEQDLYEGIRKEINAKGDLGSHFGAEKTRRFKNLATS